MANGYPTMHYNHYESSSSSSSGNVAGAGGLRWHVGAPTVTGPSTSAVPPQQQLRSAHAASSAYMPAPTRATATKRAGSSAETTRTSNKKRGKSGSAAPAERTAARPAHWAKPDPLCGFCMLRSFQVREDNNDQEEQQQPGEELVSCWKCGQSGASISGASCASWVPDGTALDAD